MIMSDFDKCYDRTKSNARKWEVCTNGEIPMWIADMDFPVPTPILEGIRERLEHPFFGYDLPFKDVIPFIVEHYQKNFGCYVEPEWMVVVPSVMPGVSVGCLTTSGRIMYCTPMYSHIRTIPSEINLPVTEVPLKLENNKYTFDFKAMEDAITPDTTSFILCNPHNPVGRIYTRDELEKLVDFCQKHQLTIISDEIHYEIVFDGKHIPLFSLCERAKVNTITITSAAKTCNIPRIPMGFAIIPDRSLREKYIFATRGLFGKGATLSGVAMRKAYDGSCETWKCELRKYLKENRDYMEKRVRNMKGISVNHNEATYLAWIDCRNLPVDNAFRFFKEEAKVYLNDGSEFGNRGFVRLNFACPRKQLVEALDRMENALSRLFELGAE